MTTSLPSPVFSSETNQSNGNLAAITNGGSYTFGSGNSITYNSSSNPVTTFTTQLPITQVLGDIREITTVIAITSTTFVCDGGAIPVINAPSSMAAGTTVSFKFVQGTGWIRNN